MLQRSIVSEQEQAFTVAIQPADGINMFDRDIFAQSFIAAGKLAQDAIWLVEDYVMQSPDYMAYGVEVLGIRV